MPFYRKTFEVTGYAPQDGGYLLCLTCHDKVRLHRCGASDCKGNCTPCDCGAVFLGSETDTAQSCDQCGAPIETTILEGK